MATYPNSRKGNTPGAPVNPATKGRAGESQASFDSGRSQSVRYKLPDNYVPTTIETYKTRQNPRGPNRTA